MPVTGIAEELIAFALAGEARYWAMTARARELDLDQPVLETAVALATLLSAASLEEAASLLRAVPDLADAPERDVRSVARWLRELYPLPAAAATRVAWFRPLGPAVLAEALAARVLAAEHTPDLAATALARARSPESVHRALTMLNQTARWDQDTRAALERALKAQLGSLWQAAVVVAQETGDPIGPLMARALQGTEAGALSVEIAERLPRDSVALREFALVAARQRLTVCRLSDASADREAGLAAAAHDLSWRLLDVGAPQEALETIGEAVAVSRRRDLLLQLAASLAAESSCLEALGGLSDAVAPAKEAVAIFRTLREREPGVLTFELASALASHASAVSGADPRRGQDALASIEESARLFGTLLENGQAGQWHDPVDIAWRLTALAHSRSSVLAGMGRARDALEASRHAVAGLRELSELNPDAYQPRLADTLSNHSSRLWALRRTDEALAALDEAIGIYRVLAAARPDAFAPTLAGILRNRSKRLRDLGRGYEAMAAVREAVEIGRKASARQGGRATAELAVALEDQSHLLARAGRQDAAVTAIDEAVTLQRVLAAEAPGDFEAELAGALSTAAGMHGPSAEALETISESVRIYRRLADSSPGRFDRELGMALANKAAALQVLGHDEQALETMTEAIVRWRRPENGDSEDTETLLADGLRAQAQLLHSAGRTREAIESGELAVTHFRALAARHGRQFAEGLARSLAQQAPYLMEGGDYERASTLGGEAVGIFKNRLKVSDAPLPRLELAIAQVNQADALRATSRDRAALAACTEAIAAFRQLGPAYADGLVAALESQAISLRELGRHEQAAKAILEAVVILAQNKGEVERPARLGVQLAVVQLEVLEHRRAVVTAVVTEEERRRDDAAVVTVAASADIYLRLAEGGERAFLPMLCRALATRFQLLIELGRYREALIALSPAVPALRFLVGEGDDDTLRAALAGALDRHAAALAAAGSPGLEGGLRRLARQLAEVPHDGEALAELTARIRRRLVDSAPDVFAVPIATSMRQQADLLTMLACPEEALSVAQESAALLRAALLRASGLRAALLRSSGRTDDEAAAIEAAAIEAAATEAAATELAAALDRIAICLGALGRREEGVEAAGEAVGIARRLLARAANPAKDVNRRQLALALHTLGRLLGELGQREPAIAALSEALSVTRSIAAADEMVAELRERLPGELERLSAEASALPDPGDDIARDS
jgi:tetratricopeptide (TPR) repeat protein